MITFESRVGANPRTVHLNPDALSYAYAEGQTAVLVLSNGHELRVTGEDAVRVWEALNITPDAMNALHRATG